MVMMIVMVKTIEQMNEEVNPSTTTLLIAKLSAFFQCLVFGPISAISSVLSLLMCSCCLLHPQVRSYLNEDGGFARVAAGCMTGWGVTWMLLLAGLPTALIILGIVAGVSVIIYPFYAMLR